MRKLIAATIALITCAPAWGFPNPIEDQTTVTVAATNWNLASLDLAIGSLTHGNRLNIIMGGQVLNIGQTTYIGYGSGTAFNNHVTVNGVGSFFNPRTLRIGQHGSGNSMTVRSEGRVDSTSGEIGWGTTGLSNLVTVTGAGSVWETENLIWVGYQGDCNALLIEDGGLVESSSGCVGYYSSNNQATIIHPGTTWNVSGGMVVGNYSGNNSLNIQSGGRMLNQDGTIGNQPGGVGNRVSVTGGGSVWSNRILYVGNDGSSNTLNVTDGGRVENTKGYVGHDSLSHHNSVSISGAGSEWISSDVLNIGFGGNENQVSVSSGGVVECADQLYIGNEGRGNELTVSSGGLMQCGSTVWLGYEKSNNNSASITAGGRVETGNGCIIGGGVYSASTNNSVTVSGAGSVWSNQGNFVVGSYGQKNSLMIADGGRVQTTAGYIGSANIAKGNTATVTGTGSVWSNSNWLIVGSYGQENRLYITDGGRVQSLDGHLGYHGSKNNKATISGTNSAWNCSGNLYIGGNSAGGGGSGCSITLSNGGMVSAVSGTIYQNHSAILQPGGTMALSSNLTANTTTAKIQIGINTSGHGKLTAGGPASLGGVLDVALLEGYSPAPGAIFDLFDWNGGVGGTFGTINLPILFGRQWNTSALYTTGELSVEPGSGDIDGDGMDDGWEMQFFGGNVSTNDNPDFDTFDNLEEFIAGTDPTNGASFFTASNSLTPSNWFIVEWPAIPDRYYTIHWASNLVSGFQPMETGIEFPQSSYTDITHHAENEGFYVIETELK